MKIKKIRGAKRRIKSIEKWKEKHLIIDKKYFAEYSRDYVSFLSVIVVSVFFEIVKAGKLEINLYLSL